MESSAGGSGTPGSSEMADLDASMSGLHLSTNKSSSPPPPETAEEAMPPSQSSAATSGDASADVVSQVDQFLSQALKDPSKRLAILRVEQDVEKFIRDPTQEQLEFQEIPNSYLRLIVHRVAQHHHLQSIAIPYGYSYRILLCKTASNYCAPPVRLADIPINLPQEDSNLIAKVAIKQRPTHSQNINIDTHFSKTKYQKRFKERKEEYDKARARIFNSNDSSTRTDSDPEDEVRLPDSLQDGSFAPARSDEKPPSGGAENYLSSCHDSSSSLRINRTKIEKEPFVSRQCKQ